MKKFGSYRFVAVNPVRKPARLEYFHGDYSNTDWMIVHVYVLTCGHEVRSRLVGFGTKKNIVSLVISVGVTWTTSNIFGIFSGAQSASLTFHRASCSRALQVSCDFR